jgi:hypothetical protein
MELVFEYKCVGLLSLSVIFIKSSRLFFTLFELDLYESKMLFLSVVDP